MSATKNGVISVQEKRELSRLINEEFSRIIKNMQQQIEFTEGEILEQARNEFGLKLLEQEIDNLKEKIKLLEDKKKEMGFDSDGYGSNGFKTVWDQKSGDKKVDPNTKAGRFYYLKMAKHADIQALYKQRDERLKKLWLENDRECVKTLVNESVNIKLIEHKNNGKK